MALTTEAGLNAAFPGQEREFTKANLTSASTAYASLWASVGNPAAGSFSIGNTTTGVIPTSATAGAFAFVNPASGNTYLGRIKCSAQNAGSMIFYDRLQHSGSYTSSAGTINANDQTAVDRDSSGAAVEVWCEINSALSATATTITITYTDQDGNTGATGTCTLPASAIAGRMFPFVLATGDSGVRSIEDVAGSAAPTGTFNIVMLRVLAAVPIFAAGQIFQYDWASIGMPRVLDNACIAIMMQTSAGSTGITAGSISIIQG